MANSAKFKNSNYKIVQNCMGFTKFNTRFKKHVFLKVEETIKGKTGNKFNNEKIKEMTKETFCS